MSKTCCITGPRPQNLKKCFNDSSSREYSLLYNRLYAYVENLIVKKDYTHFISGAALGVDTNFALLINNLKTVYPFITLELAIPCENQDGLWKEKDRIIYEHLLSIADYSDLYPIGPYTKDCMLNRNKYMVDKSDLVIFINNGRQYGGTYYTYKYALKQGKEIQVFNLERILDKEYKSPEEIPEIKQLKITIEEK